MFCCYQGQVFPQKNQRCLHSPARQISPPMVPKQEITLFQRWGLVFPTQNWFFVLFKLKEFAGYIPYQRLRRDIYRKNAFAHYTILYTLAICYLTFELFVPLAVGLTCGCIMTGSYNIPRAANYSKKVVFSILKTAMTF